MAGANARVYELVNERILAALSEGTIPWRKTWKQIGSAHNRATGHEYSGANPFLLNAVAISKGYSANQWLTYKQAKAMGGQVRKGEKATPVVFWKMLEKEQTLSDGKARTQVIPMLRYYSVFNVAQCDGIDAEPVPEADPTANPIPECERIAAEYSDRSGVTVIHRDDINPCYVPATDTVALPEIGLFEEPAAYYATLYHELGHSTGPRLGRDLTGRFGSKSYAREELVAEMSACYLAAASGIELDDAKISRSADYIAGWQKRIADDPALIVYAAGRAAKAADLVLGKTEVPATSEPETVGA